MWYDRITTDIHSILSRENSLRHQIEKLKFSEKNYNYTYTQKSHDFISSLITYSKPLKFIFKPTFPVPTTLNEVVQCRISLLFHSSSPSDYSVDCSSDIRSNLTFDTVISLLQNTYAAVCEPPSRIDSHRHTIHRGELEKRKHTSARLNWIRFIEGFLEASLKSFCSEKHQWVRASW